MENPINKVQFVIKGYLCKTCGRWHRKGSKPFDGHYADNFTESGERK